MHMYILCHLTWRVEARFPTMASSAKPKVSAIAFLNSSVHVNNACVSTIGVIELHITNQNYDQYY